MKKLVYVSTLYSLLIVLLINKKEDIILLFENRKEDSFSYYLKKINIEKMVIPKLKSKNLFIKIFEEERRNRFLLKNINNKNIDKVLLQDHLFYSQMLLNNLKCSFELIEDGTRNYIEEILLNEYNKKIIFKNKIMKFLIKNYEKFIKKIYCYYGAYGVSKKIKKIYLTGILPIPDIIKDKVELVNIEKLWIELSKERKRKILEIFDIKLEELEKLKEDKDKILLLTQPLSEDGIVDEIEKIEMYKQLLYERGIKKIYIKPHPREKTDYREVFKNTNIEVKILSNKFPAEIFMLLDMNFKKVITIFSTAALNFKYKCEVEFIGTEKYSKLYEMFGKISIEE